MNKGELVDAIAEKTGWSKKDTETFVTAFTEVVTEALASATKVTLVGFGTFEPRLAKARTARNPQTGAEITVPASYRAVFSAGKVLKDKVRELLVAA